MEQMPNEEIDKMMQAVAGFLNAMAIQRNIVKANISSSIDPNTNIITGRLYTTDGGDIAVIEMDLNGDIKVITENKEEIK